MSDNLKTKIIDYGMGNLSSITLACRQVGLDPQVSSAVNEISSADILILPGVGAFGDAMDRLNKTGLVQTIRDYVVKGKIFVGVCLGMQLLLTDSSEFGFNSGLNIIEGHVTRFSDDIKCKIPHVGWSRINYSKTSKSRPLLKEEIDGKYMYFAHSYYAKVKSAENILTTSFYGDFEFVSAIYEGNTFGFQFHPEISAMQGISIFRQIKKIALINSKG